MTINEFHELHAVMFTDFTFWEKRGRNLIKPAETHEIIITQPKRPPLL